MYCERCLNRKITLIYKLERIKKKLIMWKVKEHMLNKLYYLKCLRINSPDNMVHFFLIHFSNMIRDFIYKFTLLYKKCESYNDYQLVLGGIYSLIRLAISSYSNGLRI